MIVNQNRAASVASSFFFPSSFFFRPNQGTAGRAEFVIDTLPRNSVMRKSNSGQACFWPTFCTRQDFGRSLPESGNHTVLHTLTRRHHVTTCSDRFASRRIDYVAHSWPGRRLVGGPGDERQRLRPG